MFVSITDSQQILFLQKTFLLSVVHCKLGSILPEYWFYSWKACSVLRFWALSMWPLTGPAVVIECLLAAANRGASIPFHHPVRPGFLTRCKFSVAYDTMQLLAIVWTLWLCLSLGLFATLRSVISVSVRPYVPLVRREQLGSNWTDFHEMWSLRIFFENLSRYFKFDKTLTSITETAHEDCVQIWQYFA
jgi:hypothetical protein